MDTKSLNWGPMLVPLLAALGLASPATQASGTRGTQVDNWCAQRPVGATVPQQSRPYRASGSSCALCHPGGNNSSSNLNTLGSASRSCTSTSCPTTVNPFCINTAPTNAAISAPSTGTTVAQGASVTFTGSATDPDNFPATMTYTWTFTGGLPPVTGQSIAVPMTVAGTITATLEVRDANGAVAATRPTRSVTVTATSTNRAPNGTITAPTSIVQGQAVTFQGSAADPDGDAVTYAWSFGASATPATSSAQNPSVTFSTAGTRTVSLTVTDSRGLADPTPATAQVNVTAPPPPTTCTDADGDGFSRTGGACGPLDCNDGNAAINPGAAEACADGIDNDCDGAVDGSDKECDGTDCLARFFAQPVVITAAYWESGEEGELTVRGNQAQPGSAVTIFNADTGGLIGATVVGSTGYWSLEREGISPAPCRVRAEINGQVAERTVTNAPAPCGGSGSPPVANADSYSVTGGSTLVVVAPGVLGNDTSPSGRALTASLAAGASGGSLSLASNGGFNYTPAQGFSGTVTFSYRASDGTLTSQAATVTITVSAPNQAPNGSILAPTGTITQGQAVTFQGSGTDPDGNLPLTYAWDFGGGTGNAALQNPTVQFGSAGTYTVRLTVRDAKGLADPTPASVVVTVVAANQPPNGTIVSPSGNVTIGRRQSISFRASGSDPDGNTPLSYRWDFGGGATNSTLQNPTVRFTTVGTFTVRMTVRDSRGLSDPTPATITVTVRNRTGD